MSANEEQRRDTAAGRAEAAEESSAAQATHWHSRLEAEEPARVDGTFVYI